MGALSPLSKESSRSSVLGSADGSGHFTNQECGLLCAFTTRRLCMHRLRCQFASKRSPPCASPREQSTRRARVPSCYDVRTVRVTQFGMSRKEWVKLKTHRFILALVLLPAP